MPYLNSLMRGDLFTEVIVKISEEPAKKQVRWRGEALVALVAFILASAYFLLQSQQDGAVTPDDLLISMVLFLVCYAAGWILLNVYRRNKGNAE